MAVIDKEEYHFGSFKNIVTRWAQQAAEQFRDTYRLQRIYVQGGSPDTYSVWKRNKRHRVYRYNKPYAPGVKRRRIGKLIDKPNWTWYDEVQLRRMKKQQNPNVDYWFSTGESYKQIGVTTHDIHEDPEMFIVSGEVRFATTSHLLWAEAGVGKTGKHRVRAAKGKDIDVQRSESFRHNQRYATWQPMQGDTHRPSTRQQVYYMARRMRWLGNKYFNFRLNTWITASLREMVDTHGPIDIGGASLTIDSK